MKSALIVEDLPEVRAWLGDVARTAFPDLQVTTAARRDEALTCVQRGRFDLDGRYTVFGRVVEGLEHVEALQVGDPILRVTLER